MDDLTTAAGSGAGSFDKVTPSAAAATVAAAARIQGRFLRARVLRVLRCATGTTGTVRC
jgi:hypothetical protein